MGAWPLPYKQQLALVLDAVHTASWCHVYTCTYKQSLDNVCVCVCVCVCVIATSVSWNRNRPVLRSVWPGQGPKPMHKLSTTGRHRFLQWNPSALGVRLDWGRCLAELVKANGCEQWWSVIGGAIDCIILLAGFPGNWQLGVLFGSRMHVHPW